MQSSLDNTSYSSLHALKTTLKQIYDSPPTFHAPSSKDITILDSTSAAHFTPAPVSNTTTNSSNTGGTPEEPDLWGHPEQAIPGLKKLREAIRLDYEALYKFLKQSGKAAPAATAATTPASMVPPLSTNAPYLIAVWNELLAAPGPVVAVCKTFATTGKVENGGGGGTSSTSSRTGPELPGTSVPPAASARKPSTSARKAMLAGGGAKVDVVADGGKCWVRVNTVKNSRLLAEFREFDSYLTDSDDDEEESSSTSHDLNNARRKPSPPLDNSIIRMAHALLQAAALNPLRSMPAVMGVDPAGGLGGGSSDTHIHPRIILRLTRLNPHPQDGISPDPRIVLTIQTIRDMGVEVQLGERESIMTTAATASSSFTAPPAQTLEHGVRTREKVAVVPTKQVNLDLSVMIALVSDTTHARLPATPEEVERRFTVPPGYGSWKQPKVKGVSTLASDEAGDPETREGGRNEELLSLDVHTDLAQHIQALTGQLVQEVKKGLLEEIRDRLCGSLEPESLISNRSEGLDLPSLRGVELWVTEEVKERFVKIVSKIGGTRERRRAVALFPDKRASLDPSGAVEEGLSGALTNVEEEENVWSGWREEMYWRDSRYPVGFLPFLPIKVYPPGLVATSSFSRGNSGPLFAPLEFACRSMLAEIDGSTNVEGGKVKMTPHTVDSLLEGARRGWTTLTANRSSVRELMKVMSGMHREVSVDAEKEKRRAVIWVVDPRSLAEGVMRNW